MSETISPEFQDVILVRSFTQGPARPDFKDFLLRVELQRMSMTASEQRWATTDARKGAMGLNFRGPLAAETRARCLGLPVRELSRDYDLKTFYLHSALEDFQA